MILKPMNVGEILDNTFTMFKEQFKSYLAIAALGAAPYVGFGLLALIIYYLFGETAAIIGILFAVIPTIAVSLAMTGGLIKKASEQISGQEMSVKDAYRFGFRKAWHLFLGGLLYGLAIIIGFIFLIIPCIYLSISFVLFLQAIIIEDKGPWSALKRSKYLIKGSWWRSFGIIILITVLVSILSNIASIPLGLLSIWLFGEGLIGQVVNVILTTPVSYIFIPFSIIAYTLFYYDLRIRKENLDLKLMVDNFTESGSNLPGE